MQLITLNISRCIHCKYGNYSDNDEFRCDLHLKMTTEDDTCAEFEMDNWVVEELKETLCLKDNEIGSLDQIQEMER